MMFLLYTYTRLQLRGGKEYFSIDFFRNSALKIKLKGENTLCSLRFQCWYLIYMVKSFILCKTRNVSMGHGCPRYCQIRINRALSLTKGHNSNNNWWILSIIELDLYFMITYLCMKYESNTPTYSKDIARKPFFIRR